MDIGICDVCGFIVNLVGDDELFSLLISVCWICMEEVFGLFFSFLFEFILKLGDDFSFVCFIIVCEVLCFLVWLLKEELFDREF